MKRFIQVAVQVATLLSIIVVASGCGSNSGEGESQPQPGGPGSPQVVSGIVSVLPTGGRQIRFNGTNIYKNGQTIMVGGNLSGGQPCILGYDQSCMQYTGSQAYCQMVGNSFSRQYTYGGGSWCFANEAIKQYNPWDGSMQKLSTGIVTPAANAVGPGSPDSYYGISKLEPSTDVTIIATPGADGLHANITGVVNLSKELVDREYAGNMPNIVDIVFDFSISGQGKTPQGYYKIYGGMLLYIQKDGSANKGSMLIFNPY